MFYSLNLIFILLGGLKGCGVIDISWMQVWIPWVISGIMILVEGLRGSK